MNTNGITIFKFIRQIGELLFKIELFSCFCLLQTRIRNNAMKKLCSKQKINTLVKSKSSSSSQKKSKLYFMWFLHISNFMQQSFVTRQNESNIFSKNENIAHEREFNQAYFLSRMFCFVQLIGKIKLEKNSISHLHLPFFM